MEILVLIIAFALTITIHEMAHAWAADRLGDPSARLAGRLSLNPLVHYDPIGSTLLIVTLILTFANYFPFPFGWAKPVPIDPYNLKSPRKDAAIISLAGPAANIIFAALLSLVFGQFPGNPFYQLSINVVVLNVALAVFNLIPIHPLDGGKVLIGLLPAKNARDIDFFLNRFGLLLLFILIFPFGGVSILTAIINPIISFIVNILLPSAATF